MASVYQLNPVIRKIDRSRRDDAMNEGATVLADPPVQGMFDRWLQEHAWYRVDGVRLNNEPASFKFSFTELAVENDWRLNVDFQSTVAYVGSSEDDARMLLDGLKNGENFDRALEERIRTWIGEFREANGGSTKFVADFLALLAKLKAHLVKQAYDKLRLALVPDLAARNKSAVNEVEVLDCTKRPLNVTVNDYKADLSLELTADLRCIPRDILPYLGLITADQLKTELREAIEDEVRRNVSLQQWQFQLQTTVKEKIEKRVNAVAGKYGRQGERVLLEAKPAIEGVLSLIDCNDLSVEFEKSGYPEKVKVGLTGLLSLADLGKLATAPIKPDGVLSWMQGKLKDVANSVLLDEPYVKLSGKYDNKLIRMKERLAAAAETIGYTLSESSDISTSLDFEILREGVVTFAKEMTASLIVPECQVKVVFDVRARIEEGPLGKLFTSHVPVKEQLGAVIQTALEAELRKIDPARFYVEFRNYVVPTLKKAADSACAVKLGWSAEDMTHEGFEMTISFNYLEDNLQKLFHELRNHDVPLKSLEEPNTGIRIDAGCHVAGIARDGWLKFWRMKPTPAKIQELVELHVHSGLNDLARRYGLNVFIDASDTTIKAEVEDWVNSLLGPHVGLTVEFFHWVRQDPEAGQPLSTILADIEEDRETLRMLRQQRAAKEREGGYSAEEMKDLNDRIDILTTRVSQASRNSGAREMIQPLSRYGAIEQDRKQRMLPPPPPSEGRP